jgi:hypothetical protein
MITQMEMIMITVTGLHRQYMRSEERNIDQEIINGLFGLWSAVGRRAVL